MISYFNIKHRAAGFFAAVFLVLTAVPLESSAGSLITPIALSISGTNQTTFGFSASCWDCAGEIRTHVIGEEVTVTGTLVLQNYNLGTAIGDGNFVSFRYDPDQSKHLSAGITIDKSNNNFVGVSGRLSGYGSGDDEIVIFFGGGQYVDGGYTDRNLFVMAGPNISFSISGSTLNPVPSWAIVKEDTGTDIGDKAKFTLVPEPGTLALLGLAGVALGWQQRRRRAKQVAH